jgi:hypothetical protein
MVSLAGIVSHGRAEARGGDLEQGVSVGGVRLVLGRLSATTRQGERVDRVRLDGAEQAVYRVSLPAGFRLRESGAPWALEILDAAGRARARLVASVSSGAASARRPSLRLDNDRVTVVQPPGLVSSFVDLAWGDASTMLLPRNLHAAVPIDRGRMLIVGGDAAGLGVSEIFDPFAGTFTASGKLLTDRTGLTATQVPGGRVLIVGGAGADGEAVPTAEIFDPVTGEFSQVDSPSIARVDHVAAPLLDGSVLVAGGTVDGKPTALAERFDPSSGLFEDVGPMLSPRRQGIAVPLGEGAVLLAGGNSDGLAEIYGADGVFSATVGPSLSRVGGAGALVAGGDVLLFGGAPLTDLPASSETPAELFHTATRTFSPVGDLLPETSVLRIRPSMQLLPGGDVLIAGGASATTSTLLFVPGAGFAQGPPLDSGREQATLSLLPGGQVLLAGGGDGPQSTSTLLADARSSFVQSTFPAQLGGDAHLIRLNDGKVLAYSDSMLVLDPATGVSTMLPSGTGGGPGILLPSGKVMFPRLIEATAWPTIRTFDPATQRVDAQRLLSPGGLAPRKAFAMTLMPDGQVMLTGGYEPSSAMSNRVEIYDPSTGAVSERSPLPEPRSFHVVAHVKDSRYLILGGPLLPDYLFDVDAGTYQPLPLAVGGYLPHVMRLKDGSVLAVGASTVIPGLAPKPLLFEAATMAPKPVNVPAVSRTAAVLLPSGKVLVAGGDDATLDVGAAPLDRAWIYDPQTDALAETGKLLEPRSGHDAVVLDDGRVLIGGGSVATFEVYDPAAGQFSALAGPPALPQGAALSMLPSGRVLFSGNTFSLLDEATGQLTAAGAPLVPRTGHSATTMLDGRVLLAGGRGPDGAPMADTELFDPVAGTSSPGAALPAPRADHGAIRLASGAVLVGGGDRASIDVFGKAATGWTSPASAEAPYIGAAVVRRAAGDVLMAGGLDGDKSVSTRLTRYDPATGHAQTAAQMLVLPGQAGGVPLADGGALFAGDGVIATISPGGVLATSAGAPAGGSAVAAGLLGDVFVVGTRAAVRLGVAREPIESIVLPEMEAASVRALSTASGELLVVGRSPVDQADHWLRVLTTPRAASRPALSSVPSTLTPGQTVSVSGASLRRPSAALAGFVGPVADRVPIVVFTPDVGGGPVVARVSEVTDGSLAFSLEPSAFHGPGRLHVIVDAIASDGAPTFLLGSPPGAPCAGDTTCDTGHCVDGVCCGSSCKGPCVSCLAAHQGPGGIDGVCGDVASGEDPDDDCAADGTICGRTGQCEGGACQLVKDGTACSTPAGTCQKGTCIAPLPSTCALDGVTLIESEGEPNSCSPYVCSDGQCQKTCGGMLGCAPGFSCTSAGLCRTCSPGADTVLIDETPVGCGLYRCRSGECLSSCDQDQDCAPGLRCAGGACGPYCDGQGRAVSGSKVEECGAFRCLEGHCADSCVTNVSCADGFVCTADGGCRPRQETSADTSAAGCSTGGGSRGGPPLAIVALLLAGAFRRRRVLASLCALLTSSEALAQGPPPGEDALARAKEDFRKGVVLFGSGDVELALEYFQRSRAAFPSKQNTLDMALCLDKLGRHDEALELYQEALASFSRDFSEEERSNVPAIVAALRAKVGEIELSANVEATVVIDGRPRGKVPSSAAFRVLPGKRSLRVMRDGFVTFETSVEVGAAQRVRVDARLEALSGAGRLRVEAPDLPGGEVTVDGARLGVAPWEGTLAPGAHVVSIASGGTGSAPSTGIVLAGQTTLVRLRVGLLGPAMKISVEPPTAEVRLAGVVLGRGSWQGRLPLGAHQIEASEEGYRPAQQALEVGASSGDVALRLEIDPDHPRWPRAARGNIWLGASIGALLSGGFGSGAEAGCARPCQRSLASGGVARLIAGYRLPFGLSLFGTVGYLRASTELARVVDVSAPSEPRFEARYSLDQKPSVAGVFLGLGGALEVPIGPQTWVHGGVGAGLFLARSQSPVSGLVSGPVDQAAALVPNGDETIASSEPFVWPEVGVERELGPVRVGVSLGAMFVPTSGPVYTRAQIYASAPCSPSSPLGVGCAPERSPLAGERSHGPFWLFLPQVRVRWVDMGGAR